jgi:hypothetical protein
MGLLAAGCSGTPERVDWQSLSIPGAEKVVSLQYRTARDAFAPSKFVGVVGDGITMGLNLVWELPPPSSERMRMAQHEEKERFNRTLEMLEARQINGAEFECSGKLEGLLLHVTSVPRLTERGLRQFENQGH